MSTVASSLGFAWARIDMTKYLSVKCILYLDADIRVRKDLRSLWNIDLGR
ncbi:hypothetical protein J3R82DRAFT_11878 [Butyriboletus roseoflavus]|nr:hypothetical protein J3R82DRAFT_11878 [Butyriboletus roseoflavus]